MAFLRTLTGAFMVKRHQIYDNKTLQTSSLLYLVCAYSLLTLRITVAIHRKLPESNLDKKMIGREIADWEIGFYIDIVEDMIILLIKSHVHYFLIRLSKGHRSRCYLSWTNHHSRMSVAAHSSLTIAHHIQATQLPCSLPAIRPQHMSQA